MNESKTVFIGLGGTGIRAVKNIAETLNSGFDAFLLNTDLEGINDEWNSSVSVGEQLIGLFLMSFEGNLVESKGTEGNVALGKRAIDESIEGITKDLERFEYEKVMIFGGSKGGTGGAASYLAERIIASDCNVKTVSYCYVA